MSTEIVQILTVGSAPGLSPGLLKRFTGSGWGWHAVGGVREAETVLKTIRFKVVLSCENLADGSGYELASLIERQTGTLFIGISLSEACLWLPVVERGARTLGKRGLNPAMLEIELSQLLRKPKGPQEVSIPVPASPSIPSGIAENVEPSQAFATEAIKADLLLSVIRGNSILREAKAARATPKISTPPRRKNFERRPSNLTRLQAVGPNDEKPVTGTHGKRWRG